jgi:hypothetical protein
MASFFASLLLSSSRRIHDTCEYLQIGQIFNTLEGVLSTEQGVYIAEVVMDRNVKGARGRFKMYDDDEVPPLRPSSLTISLSLSLSIYLRSSDLQLSSGCMIAFHREFFRVF